MKNDHLFWRIIRFGGWDITFSIGRLCGFGISGCWPPQEKTRINCGFFNFRFMYTPAYCLYCPPKRFFMNDSCTERDGVPICMECAEAMYEQDANE